jgi:2-dehydro-3-deoxygluconokinase
MIETPESQQPEKSVLAVLGEPLLELSATGENNYQLGVAGDVLNTAVAVAQLGGNAFLVTAIGAHEMSGSVLDFSQRYGVNTDWVSIDRTHQTGLYMISNDEHGERSFSYWRNNSAAKNLFSSSSLLAEVLKPLKAVDGVYFSAITLSLMTTESSTLFCEWLAQYRAAGGKVIFDNNYRPSLWSSAQDFVSACERVLPLTDIFLPSLDDIKLGLGVNDREAALQWVASMAVKETIVSDGVKPITLLLNGEISSIDVQPSACVLDTTGAGDGFNGGYISARLKGCQPAQAVEQAMRVSAQVVSHKGAILSLEQWKQFSDSAC